MQNMMNNVYSSLKENTAAIAGKIAEYRKLEAQEKSGDYSREYLEKKLRPQMLELKHSIERDKEAALSGARGIVEAYQNELRDKDNLHPEDITEDAKLFTAGIKLNRRDIEAILERNKENATMTQIALRYAEENGVDLGRKIYIGHQAEIQQAGGVKSAIDYYAKWIDKDNAGDMLNKFFNVTEVETF